MVTQSAPHAAARRRRREGPFFAARPLARLAIANLRRRKAQSALLIAGIALGVAVVVAIDLANASALAAFRRSAAAVTGRATHRIVGGPTGLDEQAYVRIATDPALHAVAAAPVVEGLVDVPALDGRTLTLLGIDPLADAPFRDLLGGVASDRARGDAGAVPGTAADAGPGPLLTRGDGILLGRALATAAGVVVGDAVALDAGRGPITATLLGILDAPDALGRRALEGLVLADIGAAQSLLDRAGRLDRIDLRLPDDDAVRDAALAALAARLPSAATVEPAGAAADTVASMTEAFRLNLTALSLLALLVGMFLIFNTVRFNVVQRRPVLASLRALGVTRGQICALVLTEAAVLGVVGAVLGAGLGLAMGRGAVALVSRTINDLYFAVDVRSVDASPVSLVRGALAGLAAALLAAALPALEATRVPPVTALRRSSVEEGARGGVARGAAAALVCALAGGILLVVPSRSVALGFVALGLVIFAFALLAPAATVIAMAAVRPALARTLGLPGRMAPRDVVRSLSRTGVAVGALMVALCVSIGVGVMVQSFRQTVQDWLAQTLQADVFISPAAAGPGRTGRTLPPAVADVFRALPEVGDVATAHVVTLRTVVAGSSDPAGGAASGASGGVDGGAGGGNAVGGASGGAAGAWTIDVLVVGRDIAGAGRRYLSAIGDEAAVGQALDGGAVTISEPLARRLGLATGDAVTLRADRGPRRFPIAGVFYDYGADRGIALMRDAVYRAAWDDPRITNVALTLRPGVDADAFTADLARRFGRVGGARLDFRSNRSLRAEVFQVFDRAFAITTALQVLAVVVAFIGVLAALMAVQIERARDYATLRATGMTVGQVSRLALTQTGLLGLVAGLLSWPAGLTLALILIYVINRRSFGWTIQTHIDPWIFARALALAVAAALLAGLAPAWRLMRLPIAASLREE